MGYINSMLWIFKEVIYENWFVGIFFMESKKNVKLFIECSLSVSYTHLTLPTNREV